MPKPNKRGKKKNNGNQKKKEKSKHKMPASMIKRGNKREVVFDPEARKSHLRGFSERKRQRRAFGLAMQKVKDRQAKIEQRASEKKDELERVEEAEQQKEQWMNEIVRMNNVDSFESDEDGGSDNDNNDEVNTKQQQQPSDDVIDTKTYDDRGTESTWGGQVTVTTSVVDLDDDSDDENSISNNYKNAKSIDTAQKYAGNVQRYLDDLKGNMPGKKNRDNGHKARRKGKNGAADMKGVGGSGNFKIASKLLSKSKDKNLSGIAKGKKGKRRK
jgi:ribosomal RNA-processing protein 17